MSARDIFACRTGKVCYSRTAARRALSVCRRKRDGGNKRRHESKSYECRECGNWHLTS